MRYLISIRLDEDFFNDEDVDSDAFNTLSLPFGQDDIINWCQFGDNDFIPPSSGLDHSVIEHPRDDQ